MTFPDGSGEDMPMRCFSHVIIFLCCYFFYSLSFAESYTAAPPVFVNAKNNFNDDVNVNHSSEKIITQDEMETLGITSLSQALQELGGVQLEDTTGTGNQVLLSLRGFGANANSNTLLMVNGIPITNPDMAPPDLNAIPIQEIEHIEIISGSESVLYGDQAVGGVINIVTRDDNHNQEMISSSIGSYNSQNLSAAISQHVHQLHYSLAVLTDHTDNYRVHNNYNQNLLSGRIDYPYATGSLNFDYKIENELLLYPGALTNQEVRQNRRAASNNSDFFQDWNGFYHLHQTQSLNDQWQFNADLSQREMHGNGVLSLPFTQSREINFIKPSIKGLIGKNILVGGLDFETDQYVLNSVFDETQDALQKYGAYGLLAMPVTTKLSFSVGARGAQQNNQLQQTIDTNTLNRALATTIGASYRLTDAVKVYLKRAGNFRFPKADEEGSTPPGVNGLKTQQGVSYESGIKTRFNNFYSQFSLYQLNLNREIAFDPAQTAADPFGTNRNLDPTKRVGFTLAENWLMTEKTTLGAQYNYVSAKFDTGPFAGKRIPLVSQNILHAGLDYKITEHWNLYTEALYTGNQFPANDYANISGEIGGYTTYNVNLRYVYDGFSASFRLNNIFNKYYYLYTVFEPSMPSEFFYPANGRNVLLTVKYHFA